MENLIQRVENLKQRAILKQFDTKVLANKVLLLVGLRRLGKTELIKKYLENTPKDAYLQLNGEDVEDVEDANLLKVRSVTNYKRLLVNTKLLGIDKAQNIPEIGLILKLIVDSIDGIKVITTGSSVFGLFNKLGEPSVGRKNTIYLFPLALMEFAKHENYKETTNKLQERLFFGS